VISNSHFRATISCLDVPGLLACALPSEFYRNAVSDEAYFGEVAQNLRRAMRSIHAYCSECKATVEFVPPLLAQIVAGVSRRTIYNWLDRRWVHSVLLANTRRMICVPSLVTSSTPAQVRAQNKPVHVSAHPGRTEH
jgi:hypothetical protein